MLEKVALGVLFGGAIAEIAIRVPHDTRRKQTPVAHDQRGALETALLAGMAVGLLVVPLVYAFTSSFSFADYPFQPALLVVGAALMLASIYIFHRSHADLGTNRSPTLELREQHALVDSGIYRHIRHPMYTSIYLYALAQLCLVPNWIAGPACLVSFTAMFVLRVGVEERMMLDRFGDQYRDYMRRTKRLVPRVF